MLLVPPLPVIGGSGSVVELAPLAPAALLAAAGCCASRSPRASPPSSRRWRV